MAAARGIDQMMRRERVRAMLVAGKTREEIAEVEGVTTRTIQNDIQKIRDEAFLKGYEGLSKIAYDEYKEEVEWAIKEARKLNSRDGGRVDVLKFILDARTKKLDMAQQLGMLEKIAEKTEVTMEMEVGPETVRAYGDWLATKGNTALKNSTPKEADDE